MEAIPGQQRIKIPKPCENNAALYRFSLDVIEGMKNLRDRRYDVPPTPKQRSFLPPFAVYTRGTTLVAAPGVINSTTIAEKTQTSPADGDWFYEAVIQYNTTTGAVTSISTAWVTTETTSSDGEYAESIGVITVASGSPAIPFNYTYGPLTAFFYGGLTNKWEVTLI